jgi:iron complex transport system substrate-binding protein
VRPPRARHEKPRVSAFLSAKIDKILALQPDCVFGFSDLQADIAAALIRHGVQVTVFNQRSVDEIFSCCGRWPPWWARPTRASAASRPCARGMPAIRAAAAALPRRPRVYFEEWDEPPISAIRWVSELVGLAGGEDIFPELALQPLGKDRIVADPMDIVRRSPGADRRFLVRQEVPPERVSARPGWQDVPAVRDGELYEIKSPTSCSPAPPR